MAADEAGYPNAAPQVGLLLKPLHKSPSEHMMPSTLTDVQGDPEVFVNSQCHLLVPTEHNPIPTMTPPPIAGLSAHHLRKRQVACFIGLPLRGKSHMALRLERYLRFFHGAKVQLFDITKYVDQEELEDNGPQTPNNVGGDMRMLQDLRHFFDSNCRLRKKSSVSEYGDVSEDCQSSHLARHAEEGGFAIIYASHTCEALPSMWSGHSKWPRRWMKQMLESEVRASVCFIEVHVDDSTKHRREYIEKLEKVRGLPPGDIDREIREYANRYCTIQDDGTEDDLSYMKLLNYNRKTVTNNMMNSYIGCKITQFLVSVHPYRRTLYLTRHGESKYNEEKKIGGDSPLSELGAEYALRLGEFANLFICGRAQRFSCASCGPASEEALRQRLEVRAAAADALGGIYSRGDWSQLQDALLQKVPTGVRLARLQRCHGLPFEDAPVELEELFEIIRAGETTLVFIEDPPLDVTPELGRLWTSSMRRTNETAAHIPHPCVTTENGGEWVQMDKKIIRNLDEIYAGEFEGLTYEEVKQREPKEASLRKLDKLGYRYPRGESYYDLIARLESPLLQLETIREPIILVSHQAILRLVYAWLRGLPREEVLDLNIPLHTVIKIDIDATGTLSEARFFLGPTRLSSDDGQKTL